MRARPSRPALIYALVEHQSSDDPVTPLRMAGYLERVLEHYVQAHDSPRQLPAVVPILVSHCERPWSASVDLLALYELDEDTRAALGSHLPNVRYLLDDLSAQTEDDMRARALSELAPVTLLSG